MRVRQLITIFAAAAIGVLGLQLPIFAADGDAGGGQADHVTVGPKTTPARVHVDMGNLPPPTAAPSAPEPGVLDGPSEATMPGPEDEGDAPAGDIPAHGAFTCDFELPATLPLHEAAPLIERDRIYMSQQPGMLFKYIPLRPDLISGTLRSGGRYLFDTAENAQDYADFVRNRFVLDGVQFLDREEFLNPDCRAWHTLGARDMSGFDNAVVVRTETWHVPATNQRRLLRQRWPELAALAERQGLNSVWLLYQKHDQLVAIVTTATRVGPTAVEVTELGGLLLLEAGPPLSRVFADQQWTPRSDRTQWVANTWLRYEVGPNGEPDRGRPSLWPNSPVFPQPHEMDGVCVPSRGENHDTAPSDCTPNCGDGKWDDDEDNRRCPSDVPAS